MFIDNRMQCLQWKKAKCYYYKEHTILLAWYMSCVGPTYYNLPMLSTVITSIISRILVRMEQDVPGSNVEVVTSLLVFNLAENMLGARLLECTLFVGYAQGLHLCV
ncbi:uncharacterized protein LOC113215993 [Frankliniella occidentalis]|uniref:Uncharacterized protein LOC113215993 n=1 Tax=Frankliniella occidentalis TaxID=133901 RepID=A0A6J1TKW2_FRAOC|nr:uncharacterized protein LOC113215993 [Frankliniella occidentalis]